MFPVRCYTCGKEIASLNCGYLDRAQDETNNQALDRLGVKRYCCRRLFITQTNILGEILKVYKWHSKAGRIT